MEVSKIAVCQCHRPPPLPLIRALERSPPSLLTLSVAVETFFAWYPFQILPQREWPRRGRRRRGMREPYHILTPAKSLVGITITRTCSMKVGKVYHQRQWRDEKPTIEVTPDPCQAWPQLLSFSNLFFPLDVVGRKGAGASLDV